LHSYQRTLIITFSVYVTKALYSADGFVRFFFRLRIARIGSPSTSSVVHAVDFSVLSGRFFKVGTRFMFQTNDLSIGPKGSSHFVPLCRCWGRYPDRRFLDILACSQANRNWIFRVSAQCPCAMSPRKRISMLVHKYGTRFSTPYRVCDKHGHLDGHVCPLVPHLGACRASLGMCLSAPLFNA
jgi:hypothetical protein